MSESTYRAVARKRIKNIMRKAGASDPKKLKQALQDGYPFSARTGWPHRVWCEEVREMTGIRNKPPVNTKQPDLFESLQ